MNLDCWLVPCGSAGVLGCYLRSESRTRSFLQELLVAPLDTAVPFTQMDDIAMHIGQHLREATQR